MWQSKRRRRPKLIATVAESLRLHVETDDDAPLALAELLIADLYDAGYEILNEGTRRKERQRNWVDCSRRLAAEDECRSKQAWGERLCGDIRRLEARCVELYELARDAGASFDWVVKQ